MEELNNMEKVTIAQVINVLEQAVNIGAAKGSYAIKDAALINQSLELLKEYVKSKGDEVLIPEVIIPEVVKPKNTKK